MRHRITHSRLRRQMHHRVEPIPLEHGTQRGQVGDVAALKCKLRLAAQQCQPRFLERRVVVGIQVVQTHHLITARQQALGNVETDEAGCASHEDQVALPVVSASRLSRHASNISTGQSR